MLNYRKGAYTLDDLKYHIVWMTKYRKPILTVHRGIRTRDLIRKIAHSKNVQIIKGHVSKSVTVADETIMKYIENQDDDIEDRGDGFIIYSV